MTMVFSALRLWLIRNHSISNRKQPLLEVIVNLYCILYLNESFSIKGEYSLLQYLWRKRTFLTHLTHYKKTLVKYGWRNDNIQTAMLGQTWPSSSQNWRDPLQNQAWLTISRTLRSAQLQKGAETITGGVAWGWRMFRNLGPVPWQFWARLNGLSRGAVAVKR